MLFSFDKLIVNCIFVNRISAGKLRSAFALVNKTFKRYSAYTLRRRHYIIRKYKEKIKERFWKYKLSKTKFE